MEKILWALMDNRRGSVGQAKGVIDALPKNIKVMEKNLLYTKLSGLPNWLRGCSLIGIDAESKKISTLRGLIMCCP